MSVRTRDNSFGRTYTYTNTETWNGGGSTVNKSHTIGVSRWMVDTPTPKYKLESAKGKLFFKPMESMTADPELIYTGVQLHSHGVTLNKTINSTWTGTLPDSLNYTGYGWQPPNQQWILDEVTRLEELAVTEAYAEAGSPDLETLTELAEMRETVGFLMSPLKGMVTLTKKFKAYIRRYGLYEKRYAAYLLRKQSVKARSKPGKAQRVLRPPKPPKFFSGGYKGTDIASAWLAYRYGLMPLIYSFQDVQKLLKHLAEGLPRRQTARGKSKQVIQINSRTPATGVNTTSYAGSTFSNYRYYDGECTITCRAGVMYAPLRDIKSLMGVQINRVPKALWEAIPLSFVIDWFWTGIKYYDALTVSFRVEEILGAWVTTTAEYQILGGIHYSATAGAGMSASAYGGDCYRDKGKWKRRRNVTLSDTGMSLTADLNGKRLVDGLALIHNFLATARRK